MAKLILDNIDYRLLEKLKLRASLSGRSLDAELNSILRSVLERKAERESLRQIVLSISSDR